MRKGIGEGCHIRCLNLVSLEGGLLQFLAEIASKLCDTNKQI